MNFLTTLAAEPRFWDTVYKILQEYRRWRDKKQEERSAEADRTMEEFVCSTQGWFNSIGYLFVRILKDLRREGGGMITPPERLSLVENTFDALTQQASTTKRIRQILKTNDIGKKMTEADISAMAKCIAGALCANDRIWKTVVLDRIDRSSEIVQKGVTDKDLDEIAGALRKRIQGDPFMDEFMRCRDNAERKQSRFVNPPTHFDCVELGDAPVESFAAWLKQHRGQKVAIKGPAGIGKSRFVRELVTHLAQDTSPDALIPLCFSPQTYGDWGDFSDFLNKQAINWPCLRCCGNMNREDVIRLTFWERSDRFVFILDGLDQAPKGSLPGLLMNDVGLSQYAVLIVGRDEGFGQLEEITRVFNMPTLRLNLFQWEHVIEFIGNCDLAKRWEWGKLAVDNVGQKDEKKRVYNTPLMLVMLSEISSRPGQTDALPSSEVRLCEVFVNEIAKRDFEQRQSRFQLSDMDLERIPRIWECVAYEGFSFWESEGFCPQIQHLSRAFLTSPSLRDAISMEVGVEKDSPRIDEALQWGVFCAPTLFEGAEPLSVDRKPIRGNLCFIHLVIQEYLAAKAFCSKFRTVFEKVGRTEGDIKGKLASEVTESDLTPLMQFEPTENTGRMIAEMLNSEGTKGDDRTYAYAWIDCLLDELLVDEQLLLFDMQAKGLLRKTSQRINTSRFNLLYTAMMVRDMRYEKFNESKDYLKGLWNRRRSEAERAYEEWIRKNEYSGNWPTEFLGPRDEWARIPPGVSVIGGWEAWNGQPVRKLRFPLMKQNSILICRHKVTRTEYTRFSRETGRETKFSDSVPESMRNLTNMISSEDAQAYCEWLSGKLKESKWRARLPFELEWEFASRAGSATRYCFADEIDEHEKQIHPWKLDWLQGALWEWCQDGYDNEAYFRSPVRPVGQESGHVLRGGSFHHFSMRFRCAARYGYNPGNRDSDIGFRVVVTPGFSEL